ncbi:hypothetical protein PIROE2DRAFT_18780 [Piromyces sp. E2]|nr:hypothetical protein PIROE2DRAFT_18780 [Piromyces sp. E2]|eukprot:OUM56560.1 hypothetical protein PIROE2DRAFT_18780 [Piromyces sp. E2]
MLDSDYINLNKEDIINLLNNIVLTGTKGVVQVIPKYIGDEFYIEVTGENLDPLFDNKYIDRNRSRYIVYSNAMAIDFELQLLTNFMCRNNEITPMSRFGMKKGNYSFISQLSFEDPYSVIQDVVYGIEDNITSISSKLITGIYINEDNDNDNDNNTDNDDDDMTSSDNNNENNDSDAI